MYRRVHKKPLNPTVTLMDIEAPLVAAKAKPGQFIILRVDDDGERIPLTVAGTDKTAGTVRIIFQVVGQTKFACVDGPDFDGYEVDFDSAMERGTMYRDFERHKHEETCNLFKKAEN